MKLAGYDMQKITWRPKIQYGIILITLGFIAVNEIIIHFVLPVGETGLWASLGSFFLASLGLLTYYYVDRENTNRAMQAKLLAQISTLENELAAAQKMQQAVLEISQLFASAQAESEVVELILKLSIDVLGARGASFVPLDDRAQPIAATTRGEMPLPAANAWLEYLASPKVRARCSDCQSVETLSKSCPLLIGTFNEHTNIYCVRLQRGEQEYGLLNLFLPEAGELSTDAQEFLKKITDETAVALEAIRLRNRELNTLRQMNAIRSKTDPKTVLYEFLQNLHETLELDYSLIIKQTSPGAPPDIWVSNGEFPANVNRIIYGLFPTVLSSNDIVILKNYDQDDNEKPGGYTIFGMPMITSAESITGVLLVGRNRNLELTQRQRGLIRSLASQAALVLNNMEMLAELEYRTLIDERERLSREIHDGLAQTLGFLKLKIAQMGNYLEYGEYDQLEKAIPVCYETVSEAYIDARQAIDGLRVPSNESGIAGWLQKMVTDFVENTGLVIDLIIKENDLELPPEVNAQLMRVVQEALNNIRKHSQANQINISCGKYQDDLILEIRDNGIGFDSSDIQVPTTHGLRSMRERTELIGGEIQVIGKNNNGTIVRIRMPLKIRESVS